MQSRMFLYFDKFLISEKKTEKKSEKNRLLATYSNELFYHDGVVFTHRIY